MTMVDEGAQTHHKFDEEIVDYCFGDLAEDRRAAFEVHLLTCDGCFAEVEHLVAGVRTLRGHAQASAGALHRSDLIGLLGLSGDLDEPFAGHLKFVALATSGYAILSAEALLTELSYFLDRFGRVALWTVPLALVWVGLAMLAAFNTGLRLTRADRSNALLASGAVFVTVVGLMLVGAQVILPHEPSIASAFVPRTVAAANLRNYVLYGLPLGLLFLLIPFQFVVAIQRDLVRGRHENVLRFFSKDPLAISPRGAVYIPPVILGGMLGVAAIYLVVANQYLLDNLLAGPHSELFTTLIYLRIGTGLALGGGGLAWYIRMLNEAKREALARRSPDSGSLL